MFATMKASSPDGRPRLLVNGTTIFFLALLCFFKIDLIAVNCFAFSIKSFQRTTFFRRSLSKKSGNWRPSFPVIYSSSRDSDDDAGGDEDDQLEDTSLGDWRKFRASLIDSGLPSAGEDGDNNDSDISPSSSTSAAKKRTKSVSKANEMLLAEQNEALAAEYRSGENWAHLIAEPEVGGLLCRMPIEGEIYWGQASSTSSSSEAKSCYWKQKLDTVLSLEPFKYKDTGGENKEEQRQRQTDAQVTHWFHIAERVVSRGLEDIASQSKAGIIDPQNLDENSRVLLKKYLHYKESWQEICLVLSHAPETGRSESIVINRPITTGINMELAKLILEGRTEEKRVTTAGFASTAGAVSPLAVSRFVQAFGSSGAVYLGGPDSQMEPALMVHGIADLKGASEIAPGTGIFLGGIEAAVEGVLNGSLQQLDFRFFLGRKVYAPQTVPSTGTLLEKVEEGAYKPMACARSLALKQCLGLPKPLWHEVLELCGGEMKSISSIELDKRTDLKG